MQMMKIIYLFVGENEQYGRHHSSKWKSLYEVFLAKISLTQMRDLVDIRHFLTFLSET